MYVQICNVRFFLYRKEMDIFATMKKKNINYFLSNPEYYKITSFATMKTKPEYLIRFFVELRMCYRKMGRCQLAYFLSFIYYSVQKNTLSGIFV